MPRSPRWWPRCSRPSSPGISAWATTCCSWLRALPRFSSGGTRKILAGSSPAPKRRSARKRLADRLEFPARPDAEGVLCAVLPLAQAQGGSKSDHRAIVGAQLGLRIKHVEAAPFGLFAKRRAQLAIRAHAAGDDQARQPVQHHREHALRNQHLLLRIYDSALDVGMGRRPGLLDERQDRRLEAREAELEIAAADHRPRQPVTAGGTRLGELR